MWLAAWVILLGALATLAQFLHREPPAQVMRLAILTDQANEAGNVIVSPYGSRISFTAKNTEGNVPGAK